MMVGIRNDPGKPIDSITVQFQLPPLIVSADLTANYGTVDILADKVSVLPTISSTVTPLIPDLVTGQGKGSIVGSFRKFSKLSTLHVPSPCYASLTLAFLCRPVCGQLGRYQKTKHRHSRNLRLEEGLAQLHALPTFQVKFTIMGVALSGLQIDKLDVKNTPNAPYKSFRAQTQARKYEVRS